MQWGLPLLPIHLMAAVLSLGLKIPLSECRVPKHCSHLIIYMKEMAGYNLPMVHVFNGLPLGRELHLLFLLILHG